MSLTGTELKGWLINPRAHGTEDSQPPTFQGDLRYRQYPGGSEQWCSWNHKDTTSVL